jgi:hypothetical protein
LDEDDLDSLVASAMASSAARDELAEVAELARTMLERLEACGLIKLTRGELLVRVLH